MRAPQPIGMIRPLALRVGRFGRRRRPWTPMIWRRRARPSRGGAIPRLPQPAAVTFAPSFALKLEWIWPARFAAAPAPAAGTERPFHRALRRAAGAASAGTGRLALLVERLLRRDAPAKEAAVAHALYGGHAPRRASAEAAGARPRAGSASPSFAPPRRRWDIQMLGREPKAARVSIIAASPVSGREPKGALLWREGLTARGPRRSVRADARTAEANRAPSPPQTALIWPKAAIGPGLPQAARPSAPAARPPRTILVWRNAAAGGPAHEEMPAPFAAAPAAWRAGAAAQAAPATAAAAPAQPAAQAPDMGRLVDEVVRRLERIGRDERLRRGI